MQKQWISYYNYIEGGHHSVVGNVCIQTDFHSPQLQNQRNILVYLPPSYAQSDRRYPVMYMHDGQNLFDNTTSYAGEWQVDETMEYLAYNEGLEAIVVAVPNMGAERTNEYSPFHDPRHGGGRGGQYLAFLAHSLKPQIDRDFRTMSDRMHTGIMGSSMGGLISLYAFFQHHDTFGFAGVMSPSLWFAHDAIMRYVQEKAVYHHGRIYLDAGTREYGDGQPPMLKARSRRYYGRVRRMKRMLVRLGYRPIYEIMHIEGRGHGHRESAWAHRLPNAIRYFLKADVQR